MGSVVSIDEVESAKSLARFVELPQALDGNHPCFAPLVMSWERVRLDRRRNPHLEDADAAWFLARRLGRPAGRIAAHLGPDGRGRFGLWWTAPDEPVAAALLDAAREWLAARGCTSMEGPWSLTEDDEVGVQVDGHDRPGTTGRPWHPSHLASLLEGHGLTPVADRPTWRLPAGGDGPVLEPDHDLPHHAGAYADPRLVLHDIAAVPDVSPALRSGGGLRTAWVLARQAKGRRWETCTVVRCRADPAVVVPALQQAAGEAGYRWVVGPWCPDASAPPEATHRVYRLDW